MTSWNCSSSHPLSKEEDPHKSFVNIYRGVDRYQNRRSNSSLGGGSGIPSKNSVDLIGIETGAAGQERYCA